MGESVRLAAAEKDVAEAKALEQAKDRHLSNPPALFVVDVVNKLKNHYPSSFLEDLDVKKDSWGSFSDEAKLDYFKRLLNEAGIDTNFARDVLRKKNPVKANEMIAELATEARGEWEKKMEEERQIKEKEEEEKRKERERPRTLEDVKQVLVKKFYQLDHEQNGRGVPIKVAEGLVGDLGFDQETMEDAFLIS